MTKHRFYVQKDLSKPELDLWVELWNQFAEVPVIRFCYNGEKGKEIALELTTATAARLRNALDELLELSAKTFDDYVAENND